MSAAATADAAPPAKGKKKLILIIAVALAVVLGGGGAAMVLMKKKHVDAEAEADADGEEHAPAKSAKKDDHKAVPVFVPLDPFTVNLADRDAERYAQVGITLEIEDAKVGEQIKAYMPAIRNNILMAIADRTAADLMGRDGKAQLAERVKRETSKALGFDVPEEEAPEAAAEEGDEKPKGKAKAKKKKKKAEVALPVRAVHFSNFIIQ